MSLVDGSSGPWRVGVLFSQSGVTSAIERTQLNATLLAIEEINTGGGVLGRPIEPVMYDPASDPKKFRAFRGTVVSGRPDQIAVWLLHVEYAQGRAAGGRGTPGFVVLPNPSTRGLNTHGIASTRGLRPTRTYCSWPGSCCRPTATGFFHRVKLYLPV